MFPMCPPCREMKSEAYQTFEALKMFAAVASPGAGAFSEICVKIGESKDLLVRLVK